MTAPRRSPSKSRRQKNMASFFWVLCGAFHLIAIGICRPTVVMLRAHAAGEWQRSRTLRPQRSSHRYPAGKSHSPDRLRTPERQAQGNFCHRDCLRCTSPPSGQQRRDVMDDRRAKQAEGWPLLHRLDARRTHGSLLRCASRAPQSSHCIALDRHVRPAPLALLDGAAGLRRARTAEARALH